MELSSAALLSSARRNNHIFYTSQQVTPPLPNPPLPHSHPSGGRQPGAAAPLAAADRTTQETKHQQTRAEHVSRGPGAREVALHDTNGALSALLVAAFAARQARRALLLALGAAEALGENLAGAQSRDEVVELAVLVLLRVGVAVAAELRFPVAASLQRHLLQLEHSDGGVRKMEQSQVAYNGFNCRDS